MCSQCSCEEGLRYEGYITGSIRTGEPTSQDKPTQVWAEEGGTSYDRVGQTRPCQWRDHEYFPWRVRAPAYETPEVRSYISLMVYPNDRSATVHIDLAKVTWVEADWAGAAFLGVSPQNQELHRLCGDQAEIPLVT